MKKFLMASAMVMFGAGAANAFELGEGLSLDNTITGEYKYDSAGVGTPSITYSTALTYALTPEIDVYVSTSLDLLSPSYDGFFVGADYDFADNATIYGKVRVDNNADFDYAVVGVSLTF